MIKRRIHKLIIFLLCFIFSFLSFPCTAFAGEPYVSYTYTARLYAVGSMNGYVPDKVYVGADFGTLGLNTPKDLEIDQEGNQEQQQSNGEQRVVLDRSDSGVPEGGVGDKARHGLPLLERIADDASLVACGDCNDHGLAHGPRDAEHNRSDDAGECRRKDDAKCGLHAVCAQSC